MRKFLIAALCVAALCVQAQNISLWKTALPGHRKALDVSTLPEGIFASHAEVVAKKDTAAVDNGYATKLAALKITALVWSDTPGESRVLMGDIVMKEGQDMPQYIFNDGKVYTLKKIEKDRLDFETMDDSSNPVAFQVSFGLKESLKNESSYSSQSQK